MLSVSLISMLLRGYAPRGPFFRRGLHLFMPKEGEIVEVGLLADKRTRFDAVICTVAGNQLEIMCFQELCTRAAISIDCSNGYAVGHVLAVSHESDGLMAYRIKIHEIVTQTEERTHISWRARRD